MVAPPRRHARLLTIRLALLSRIAQNLAIFNQTDIGRAGKSIAKTVPVGWLHGTKIVAYRHPSVETL